MKLSVLFIKTLNFLGYFVKVSSFSDRIHSILLIQVFIVLSLKQYFFYFGLKPPVWCSRSHFLTIQFFF